MTIASIARGRLVVLIFSALAQAALPVTAAHARPHRGESWARERFAAADGMREALNGRPAADRSRRDYQRVLNAYRTVYYGAPSSTKADPSVVAVAETLVEMGRRFDDDKILNEAVAQYRFLRKEYPGSKYRCDALFTIGEIYKDDLDDPDQARATFQEFLHRYPHNRLVDDAQQAIVELDKQAAEQKKAEEKAVKESAAKTKAPKDAGAETKTDTTQPTQLAAEKTPSQLPRVTGIRHWSTPDYTRVAIDLESEVKYGSQRISNPDRIFFDLRDTKLASTLVGKSFDVDDGFLKKIRVAQFQPERTRVVLEVKDLSNYEAFLLPNPYRLIVDVHGKNKDKNKDSKIVRARAMLDAMTATADVEAGPKIGAPAEMKTEAKNVSPVAVALKVDAANSVTDEEVVAPATEARATETPANTAKTKAAKLPPAVHTVTLPNGVKKVIVEADDGRHADPEPATKADAPKPRKAAIVETAVSRTDSAPDADSTPADDTAAGDAAIDGPPVAELTSQRVTKEASDLDVHEAKPTARGDRSLIRALGLKIGKIVIDPGHGGYDTGTIGPNGLEEKDLVLEVGRRLGKMLESRLGAEVVYTRKNDTFIPLETRTAIANQQRADLFISIHANSSQDEGARGVETYYLNFTSSPEALEVAARENAVSEKSIYELQDLVKKIALKEKIEESREFAGDVQQSLHAGLAAKSPAIRNRGVKKAPFIVLIGANMPSILAEISFVSNPTDERRLETSEYRQKIAESLYRGVAKYVNGLSGVKMASKMDKVGGQ